MRIGIFITARLGSSRLKEKLLLKLKGRPILNYSVDRIRNEFAKEIKRGAAEVFIVTGNEKNNKRFEKEIPNCKVFYGDDDNIPKRHLQAAKAHNIDIIVSIDGDDILCSPHAMRLVYEKLVAGEKYVSTEGMPIGLNAFGYTTAFLESCLAKADYKLLETGWGRIFDTSALFSIKVPIKNVNYLRFTLDYDKDFEFFKAIITHPGINITTIQDDALIDLVINEKIYEKNAAIAQEYWDNFLKKRAEEEAKKQQQN